MNTTGACLNTETDNQQTDSNGKVVHYQVCLSRRELYRGKYEAAKTNVVREIPLSQSKVDEFFTPAVRLLARMRREKTPQILFDKMVHRINLLE